METNGVLVNRRKMSCSALTSTLVLAGIADRDGVMELGISFFGWVVLRLGFGLRMGRRVVELCFSGRSRV